MTAAKFKPLIFSVSGFALSNVANILIFMILDYFYLLSAWFCYVIINIWYMKSFMHISDRLCGLVVRVLDYRCRGPGSIPGYYKKSSGSGTGSTQPREHNSGIT
jgi:hypothetical protein